MVRRRKGAWTATTGGLKADLRLNAEAQETLLEELERVRAEQHQIALEELERVRAEQHHVGDDSGDEGNKGDSGDEAHDASLAKASLDKKGLWFRKQEQAPLLHGCAFGASRLKQN